MTVDELTMNCDEMPVTTVALAISKERTSAYMIFLTCEKAHSLFLYFIYKRILLLTFFNK